MVSSSLLSAARAPKQRSESLRIGIKTGIVRSATEKPFDAINQKRVDCLCIVLLT